MRKIWDEESIREEIRRLDKKTGLNGANLPITFGNARDTLGCFYVKNRRPYKFHF